MSVIIDLKNQENHKHIINPNEIKVKEFMTYVNKFKDKLKYEVKKEVKKEVKEGVEEMVRNITRDEIVKTKVPTYVTIKNITKFPLFHIILLIVFIVVIIIVVKKVKDKLSETKYKPKSN